MNLHATALPAMLLAALCGCQTARIRAEASPVLRCPEAEIDIEEREPGTYAVTGCGRMAVCSLPPVDRAELRCEGGADPRHLPEIQPLPPAALIETRAGEGGDGRRLQGERQRGARPPRQMRAFEL